MPKFAGRAIALFVLLLVAAGTSVSAATNDFYLNLLRRGVANFEAGEYEAAVRELDVAAFGLIESIDHFETAKVYAAIANDKLGRTIKVRAAAQRILAAERVQRRFAQLALPAEVRSSFLVVARKVLSSADVTALSREDAPVPPASASQQPRIVQQPPTRTQAPGTPQRLPPVPQPQVSTQQPPRKIEETIIEFPAEPAPVKPRPKAELPKVDPRRVDPPKPAPAPPSKTTTQPAPRDIPARLATAERLLSENNLIAPRAIYRGLLDAAILDHATILAIGEGLYRAQDFTGAVRAFERAGTVRSGEERYRYYLAVALYETGNYAKAKRELAAALPHIEITPSVNRYRAKIEASAE